VAAYARPVLSRESYLDLVRAKVAAHGHFIQYVAPSDDGPGWGYTVGLAALDHPEVLCVGMPQRLGHSILNRAAGLVHDGAELVEGSIRRDVLPGSPAAFIALDPAHEEYIAVARRVDPAARALQLVWPDAADRLPWEPGYEDDPAAQSLLGNPP
jgi:hypothetical protein